MAHPLDEIPDDKKAARIQSRTTRLRFRHEGGCRDLGAVPWREAIHLKAAGKPAI
jgi:hypothetical protein